MIAGIVLLFSAYLFVSKIVVINPIIDRENSSTEWKQLVMPEVSLQMKYPSSLYASDLKIRRGKIGTGTCVILKDTPPPKVSLNFYNAHCFDPDASIIISTTSVTSKDVIGSTDFESQGYPLFTDSSGYFYQNGNYYIKYGNSMNTKIPRELLREVVFRVGNKFAIIKGQENKRFSLPSTPGSNWVGAIRADFSPTVIILVNTQKVASEKVLEEMLGSIDLYAPLPKDKLDTVNWKEYKDENGKYSFSYPSDWTATKDEYGRSFISGKQGEITIMPGRSDGGGCDNWILVRLKKITNYGCQYTQDKKENLYVEVIDKQNEAVRLFATYPEDKDNRALIRTILSTFDFQ